MEDMHIVALRRTAKMVVAEASRPGGPLEKGEFTMAIARKEISRRMGFGEEGLEKKEWRTQVKDAVKWALVSG